MDREEHGNSSDVSIKVLSIFQIEKHSRVINNHTKLSYQVDSQIHAHVSKFHVNSVVNAIQSDDDDAQAPVSPTDELTKQRSLKKTNTTPKRFEITSDPFFNTGTC